MGTLKTKRASHRKAIPSTARRRSAFRPSTMELLETRITPAYSIRATELSSLGSVIASSTQSSPSGPGNGFNAIFTLPDFSIAIVGNNSTTGPSFAAHSTTINMLYTGPTGANSDQLLIEVLGDSYTTPEAGLAQITSDSSVSTSGLAASSVTMTSGVLNGNVPLSSTPGTILGGQLGTTTGTGSIGSAASVLTPNPTVSGAVFTIANPFTFYQTYAFAGFTTANQAGSMIAGSTVNAVPNANNPSIAIVKLTDNTNNDSTPVPGTPDGPVLPVGSTVTWTYDVTNPGNEPIANVSVTDSDPSVLPTPVLSGGFNVGDTNDNGLLDPGETWVYTASGTVTAGQYSNIGTASGTSTISNTPVSANNPDHYFGASQVSLNGFDYLVSNTIPPGSLTTATTGVPIPGTTVTLTGTDEFGNPVNATTTTNASGFYSFTGLYPSNGSGYTVTETPPASDTHVGQTSTTTGATTNTPPGTPAVVSNIVLTSSNSPSTDNFFESQSVSINGNDYLVPNSVTASNLTPATTGTPIPGTTVALTGTDEFGNPVSASTTTDGSGFYSFTGLNPSSVSGYTVTETPPSNLSHVGQTSTTSGAVTNTPPGTPSVVSNIVLTTANSPSTDNFFETPAFDLAITKTDGTTTYTPGGSTTYTIVVSNNGPSAVTGAPVNDPLPASITSATWTAVASAGASVTTSSGTGSIVNDLVSLVPGSTVTFTLVAQISPSATGNLTNTATVGTTATMPAGVTDSNPSNNTATDTDTPTPAFDLAISKTDGTTTYTPGGSATYTIVVSNNGPSAVTGALVVDNSLALPPSPRDTWSGRVASAGASVTTSSGTGSIVNDLVSLVPGSTVTFFVPWWRADLGLGHRQPDQHRHRRHHRHHPGGRHRQQPGEQHRHRHRHPHSGLRPGDHQDRRHDHLHARRQHHVHDRGEQQRPFRRHRRPGRRQPPRRHHLGHLDGGRLLGRQRDHVERHRQHRRQRQPGAGVHRHLHPGGADLALGHRQPDQHRHRRHHRHHPIGRHRQQPGEQHRH